MDRLEVTRRISKLSVDAGLPTTAVSAVSATSATHHADRAEDLAVLGAAPLSSTNSTSTAAPTPEPPANPHWRNLVHNPFAGLVARDSLLQLCDLGADGEWQAVGVSRRGMGDGGPSSRPAVGFAAGTAGGGDDAHDKGGPSVLVAWTGSRVTWERELYDAPHYAQPTSIDTFYNEPLDTPPPRQPIIVLACGSDLHVFKRRKPLTVVRVPDVPVDEAEREVWTRFVDGRMGGGTGGERDGSVGKLVEALRVLAQREGGIRLSSRTREVLAAASARDDELVRVLCEYFKDHYAAYRQSDYITCTTILKRSVVDENSACHLIVCTEHLKVYVYETVNFTPIQEFDVSSPVCTIAAYGVFDVNYHMVAACRDGGIYVLGNKTCNRIIQLESLPLSMITDEKSLRVATMDNRVTHFSLEGKRLASILMPEHIVAFQPFVYAARNIRGWMVSLANREVRLYVREVIITTIEVEEIVTAMRFGTFDREQATFCGVTITGGLLAKTLRREKEIDAQKYFTTSSSLLRDLQDRPLPLPIKTNLFLEQRAREKADGGDMHRIFQKDLFMLRLNAARTYVKTLTSAIGPVASASQVQLKLDTEIFGIGPLFTLRLVVQYVGRGTMGHGRLFVGVNVNPSVYRVTPALQALPALVPNIKYTHMIQLENCSTTQLSDTVEIFVVDGGRQSTPLVLTLIVMPMTQMFAASATDVNVNANVGGGVGAVSQ